METSHAPLVSTFPLSFNLKSLLFLVTVVGILVAPAQWLGGVYLVSIAFSAGLVICCALAYRNVHPAAAIGVAIVGVFVGLPLVLVLVVFFLHAILNAGMCLLLLPFQLRPRGFVVALTVLGVGFYAYVLSGGIAKYQELAALRDEYPLVSLADRLAFERSTDTATATSTEPLPMTPVVIANLDDQEDRLELHYFDRAWGLEELHERSYEHFARATGFGFMRMPSLDKEMIELEPRGKLELPAPLASLSPTPPITEFDGMHDTAIDDFLDPNRIGFVRSRDAVAGFDAHGLTSLAFRRPCPKKQRARWQVVRLELVGLLRHDEPRVYVAATMPAMDELSDVPTRPLNDFERGALLKLMTQEDIVVDQRPERIRMLGAVRAGKSCLQCHEGPRGKLLGAFSYEIVPHNPRAEATTATASALPGNPFD